MADKTHNVKIKIRAFPYYTREQHPVTGEDVHKEHLAYKDDEIELSERDYKRALEFDAIYTGNEPDPDTVGADSVVADEESDDVREVAAWITESKPTIEETLDSAGGDPDRAELLLEAENLATGGQPRKGVVDGLQALIDDNGDGE